MVFTDAISSRNILKSYMDHQRHSWGLFEIAFVWAVLALSPTSWRWPKSLGSKGRRRGIHAESSFGWRNSSYFHGFYNGWFDMMVYSNIMMYYVYIYMLCSYIFHTSLVTQFWSWRTNPDMASRSDQPFGAAEWDGVLGLAEARSIAKRGATRSSGITW
jgi:hypothetical protein